MRYRFRGVELRTENAAKPYRQASRWVVEQISLVPSGAEVLDYGCGKFRYTVRLSRRARLVCAVDSAFQIARRQWIAGKYTTLREYAGARLRNVEVCEVGSEGWRRRRFDFVLCANVLSVIPRRRERVNVLQELGGVLRPHGRILATTQFRNTHFRRWATDPCAEWVRDGWFVNGPRGASFYAIIPPKALARLCRSARLAASDVGSHGETAYVFAGLP